MFSPKTFLAADVSDNTFEVCHGGETFLIRRLNGEERLEFTALKLPRDRVLYSLSHCLLDGVTKEPVGDETALRLLRSYDSLSNQLAVDIVSYTLDCIKTEQEFWGLAKKK